MIMTAPHKQARVLFKDLKYYTSYKSVQLKAGLVQTLRTLLHY